MEYCDLIAKLLSNGLKNQTLSQDVHFFGIRSKNDLHPEGGYMRSTDKFITCRDNKGNKYKITVEAHREIPAQSKDILEQKLHESNMKHCRNGDQLGYLIDQLRLKLDFSAQDSDVLADITDEEIEALKIEVENASQIREIECDF